MSAPEHPGPSSAQAEGQLGRSVLAVFVLAAVTAVGGPLISYRSDVAELRSTQRAHLVHDLRLYAEALDRHLALLQAELLRLAARPEVDLRDESSSPERELLATTHQGSALFATGVALVDSEGKLAWAEPSPLPVLGENVERHNWFQRLLARQTPVVDILDGSSSTLAVAVPVLRGGKVTGAAIGLLESAHIALPLGQRADDAELVLLDSTGDAIGAAGSSLLALPRLEEMVGSLLRQPQGMAVSAGGEEQWAAATEIGRTGLRLVLAAPEARLLAPMRQRFLLELVLVSSVQIAAVLLLTLFVRRVYRRFLAMERRAVQQEKLAALGGASSLIAHEVRNALNVLNAAVSPLSGDSGTTSAVLPVIKGQIDRLRHLATSLLEFSRPTNALLVESDLAAVVRQAVEALRILPEAGEVAIDAALEPLSAPCDPLLLTTAIDNLVRNAIEASASAKDLGRLPDPSVQITLSAGEREKRIAVEDRAGGPPPGFEERLFQPFQTSKAKGIGLGLLMARRAVEQQGGTLDFERTSAGCRFTIRLPSGSTTP